MGTGALVGIHMQRCPEMISALLGTLKAGGAYVPLDPQWPAARLALVIDDAQVVAVLTDATGEPELRRHVEHAICLDRDVGPTDDRDDENPRPVSGPRDLAYVVYTSGSTGRPKGVLIEHRSLVNYVSGVSRSLHLADLRSFAALQPLHVDSSVTAIYPPLFSGGRLHLISEDMALDPLALAAYFKTHDIECLKIAPSHLMALNAEVEQPIMPRKLLIVGGEEIQSEWVARLQGAAPDCRVVNHYGPTEATVGATAHPVVGHHSGRLPIGRLLPNVQAFVLDRYGSPVPIGVAGELYLGGDCLARGYLNLPDATAGAFVPDLLSGTDGARLYRTGDMVRYRPDGSLEFLGDRIPRSRFEGIAWSWGRSKGPSLIVPTWQMWRSCRWRTRTKPHNWLPSLCRPQGRRYRLPRFAIRSESASPRTWCLARCCWPTPSLEHPTASWIDRPYCRLPERCSRLHRNRRPRRKRRRGHRSKNSLSPFGPTFSTARALVSMTTSSMSAATRSRRCEWSAAYVPL